MSTTGVATRGVITANQSAVAAVSVGSEVSSARRAELGRWLDAKRALVFSSDVDGAYGDLYKAHRERQPDTTADTSDQPRILKLRLKDSTDEAYHRRELQGILRDGGTLVLDLRGADPKLIKEWNSLYDFDAAGKGVQSVSGKLVIVALADTAAEAPPESVTSRSAKFFDQSKDKKPDPLKALQGEVEESTTTKVNLHQDADPKTWRYELLGSGKTQGALIKAMQEGSALEIQNAPIDQSSRGGAYDPELANLLRQVAVERRIMHAGQWVCAKDTFKVTLTQRELEPPHDFRLQAEGEAVHIDKSAGRLATFYVNRHTVGMLFSRTVITSSTGKLARKTGLLDIAPRDGEAPIQFVITEALPLGKWNKLLSHPAFSSERGGSPIIAVRAGVAIPKRFKQQQSDQLKAVGEVRNKRGEAHRSTALSELPNALESSSRVILLKADLDLALTELQTKLSDKAPTYLQMTPYRGDEELWETVTVEENSGKKRLVTKESTALEKLKSPDGVVVLSGIDSRSELFKEQPGLLTPEPYLLVHGKVVAIHGRLILVQRPSEAHSTALQHAADVVERHISTNTPSIEQLQQFERSLASIPPYLGVVDKELYPSSPRTNLRKLELFVAQYAECQDWAKAADIVFGGDYGLHPEARAFIRVQARRIFETNQQEPPSIDAAVIRTVQDSSGELAESPSHMWRLLDALNPAALAQTEISGTFTAKITDHTGAWDTIKRSLYMSSNGELQAMYKQRFNLQENVVESVCKVTPPADNEKSPWTQMRDTTMSLLTRQGVRPQVLFLQGAPGRGKSHLIRDVRTGLQNTRSIFGPITANPDMVFKSEELDTLLRDWRASTGGILLIDEGNLLPQHFWDRLREDLLADPTKTVVFSGNETFQSGRHPIALAEELGVTLFFEQFSKDEKASMIAKYTADIPDSSAVSVRILEFTNFLENNQFNKSFTPRDLQEVCDLARCFGSSQAQVITHIWRVYSPVFTTEEQEAFRVYAQLQYGVDLRKIIQDAKSSFSTTHSEQLRRNGFVLRDESLAVATELAQIVELSRKRGELGSQEGGKRGVIIEAESGWGKDFTAVKTLEALGFERGNVTDDTVATVPASGAKRYYVINAELDFTTLQQTIARAAREGAVLIIREANALDAGILEAQVNDILTGNVPGVHPAFITVMTVNSADVESMSAFSSALISRVHHIKARPHSRETLEDIVRIGQPQLESDTISKIVGLHLFLRDSAEAAGRRPNTRDLLRAASEAATNSDSWQLAVVDSYLFYIEHGVKRPSALAEATRFLDLGAQAYVPRSEVVPVRIMKALAQAGLPGYVGDIKFVVDYGCAARGVDGYFHAKTGLETAHTIGISPQAIMGDRWREVILHEVRHALHDCGEGISYGDLEQDIRDLRNQASFAHFVPGSRLMELTHEEANLPSALKSGTPSLRSDRDFRLLMALIAKTEDKVLSKGLLESCVRSSGEGDGGIVSLAIKHFDLIREISSCFAKRGFGDEFPSIAELHAKQVRLNEIVSQISKDYIALPKEEPREAGGVGTGLGGGTGSGGLHPSHQEAPDPRALLRHLETSLNLPQGSLAGPESVTHHSGDPGVHHNAHDILPLEDPLNDNRIVKTQELSEEDKKILSEAQARAAQADTSLWQSPKELWEEVVSQWSETSVSNGRRTDPSGSLQIDEIFSGVRPEDARVSPGADVERERKVIRLVDLTSQLTAQDLGLCKELFHLGFSIALGDREPVSSCLALCVQEQELGHVIQRADVATRLSPSEQRRSELLSLQELKSHLEAVATYAALSKGVELLEQKNAGSDISTAKKIEWPKLANPAQTNEIVLHYLEDNQGVLRKLKDVTKDKTQSEGQTAVELYMEQLEAELGQIEELDRDEQIAQEAIFSYHFDPPDVYTFTRPAGVTDVELMKALNKYFRNTYPHINRDAVYEGDLYWYEDLPRAFRAYCAQRNYSQATQVAITAIDTGTMCKDRISQEKILKSSFLVFSDPRDMAIAAALHACKHNGQDLFQGLWVRGSVPGFALGANQSYGVFVPGFSDGYDHYDVAASGSPSPELKKT